MRQIVLDTETTGLEPQQGHRLVEIGGVELSNRRRTGRRYHQYLQPDREVDEGAVEVHGLTDEFLADKPRFADVVDEFMAFIRGAELIIHNAPFDVGFINHELQRFDPSISLLAEQCTILDTLALARQLHPGQRNSLDALCKRYLIDNSHRELHGALLDAEILTDLYLAMTGGQVALPLETEERPAAARRTVKRVAGEPRSALRVIYASNDEITAHDLRLAAIGKESGGRCLWQDLSTKNSG
ncbi:MAG: DNA polymerase III subunit epsilon [Halothiobacillaceae bacterium]|nr:MAG: DNA polymerase III subunit epsilon [Halothiobacillaceae bacterium]